jgi:hypothetical protein
MSFAPNSSGAARRYAAGGYFGHPSGASTVSQSGSGPTAARTINKRGRFAGVTRTIEQCAGFMPNMKEESYVMLVV